MNWEKLIGVQKAGQPTQWTDPFNRGGIDITDNKEVLTANDPSGKQYKPINPTDKVAEDSLGLGIVWQKNTDADWKELGDANKRSTEVGDDNQQKIDLGDLNNKYLGSHHQYSKYLKDKYTPLTQSEAWSIVLQIEQISGDKEFWLKENAATKAVSIYPMFEKHMLNSRVIDSYMQTVIQQRVEFVQNSKKENLLNNIKLTSFFIAAIIILILLFKHKERVMDFIKQNKSTIVLALNSLLVLFLFSIIRDSINFRMLIAISIAVFNGVYCIKSLTSKEFVWISHTANALLVVLSLDIKEWAYAPWTSDETYRVIISIVAIVNMAYTYTQQRKSL